MPMIYDLDNEGGGQILADSNTTQAALQINNNAAGQPAISILSTASGSPIKITTINSSVDIDSVAASVVAAVDIRSGATSYPALTIGRTAVGVMTVAPLQFLGTSVASGALMQFDGGFISCLSVVLTTVANIDYVIPVQVGLETRYISLLKGAGIVTPGSF